MSGRPTSPAPVTGLGDDFLPAYVSNGVVGLRVREVPLLTGVAVLDGLAGEHPVDHVECTPHAPYPLSGDLRVGRVRLSDFLLCVRDVDQRYDFGSGELTSRFVFVTPDATAEVEVTTFCSRTQPAIVAQRVQLIVDCAVRGRHRRAPRRRTDARARRRGPAGACPTVRVPGSPAMTVATSPARANGGRL